MNIFIIVAGEYVLSLWLSITAGLYLNRLVPHSNIGMDQVANTVMRNISKQIVSKRELYDSFLKMSFLFIMMALLFAVSCSQVEEVKELRLGDPAPDFAVKDLQGGVFVLSSKLQGPVILRFFESDCRICKADTPVFTKVFNKHGEGSLSVLYVGSFYDTEKSLRKFVVEQNIDFPVAMDGNGRLADLYNIKAYPQTLFIGPQGELLAGILGGVGEAEVFEIIGKYL